MRRWLLWGAGVIAVLVIALLVVGKYRPDWILLRVAPIMMALQDPIGPPQVVHWETGPATAKRPASERPPNIVIILADDLGWNGVSLNGGIAGGAVATPHINAIARHGVAFADGYAGNAVCAPSRAALMTGRYATRFGYEFTPVPGPMVRVVNSLMQRQPHFVRKPELLNAAGQPPPFDSLGMPTTEITLGQLLQQAGYHTLHIGKWHLGENGKYAPIHRGFDESLQLAGLLYRDMDAKDVVNAVPKFDPLDQFLTAIGTEAVRYNSGPRFNPEQYLTDYFTDEAVKAIHANRNRPFFLFLAHWAVHAPLQATRSDYAALAQIKNHDERVYAGMIRALDRSVGRVMQALKDNGIADNTLVFFTSDNGAPGYMGLADVNAPYRGWKLTYFEGGLRVPFYMQWPAKVKPGQVYNQPVQAIDLFSTIAAAAHAPLPADRKIDGVNLLPYITGTKVGAPHDMLFWRDGPYLALIDKPWKLQVASRPDKTWLFNLQTDPTEQHNVASKHPEVVARLKRQLAAINAQQVEPLWPPSIATPILIDKSSAAQQTLEDEYVYWTN